MSGGENSVVSRVVDRVFPRMPDFYGLLNRQCQLVSEAMDLFVQFMQTGEPELGRRVRELEKEADDAKAHNMDILNRAFATPMDREDIYRAIMAIDEVLNYAKTTVRELEVLQLSPDPHMVRMAELIRDGADALTQGFGKLSSEPATAEADAQAARKSERNTEKVYRKALAELFRADAHITALGERTAGAEVNAMTYVIEIFKRREVYRHLSNAADRVERAGEVLHDIVVQIS